MMINCSSTARYFWRTFTPIAVIIILLSTILYHFDKQETLTLLKDREYITINKQQALVIHEFQDVISDLLVLSKSYFIQKFVREDTQNTIHIEQIFKTFVQDKKKYDQIRFIAADGKEAARINWNAGKPAIIPQAQLQNKSARYYFSNTIKLKVNQIFVSPFDLNIEHGKIEFPLNPMIRFSTPIFNPDGIKIGMIIINYQGNKLLTQLKQLENISMGKVLLLNQDGFYLLGLKSADEWGFMTNEKTKHNFSSDYPLSWQAISVANNGQINNKEGLFSFAKIHPLSSSSNFTTTFDQETQLTSGHHYTWTLISYLSPDNIPHPRITFYFLGVSLLLLMFATVIYRVAKATIQRNVATQQLKQEEEKLRLVADYTYDWEYWLSPKGEYLYISPACERISGYTALDFIQNSDLFLSLLHSDDFKRVKKHWEIRDSSHDTCMLDFRIHTQSGEEKWISHTCQPVFQEDGTFLGRRGSNCDISLRKKIEIELEKSATHDVLTQLPNRKYVYECLPKVLAQAKRANHKVALLFIDLDKFKLINDTFGHRAGDTVLQSSAFKMKKELRLGDTLARLGGDEFLAIIPDIDSSASVNIITNKLIKALKTPVSIEVEGKLLAYPVEASIGISLFPDNGQTIDELIHAADKSMYIAKKLTENVPN